MSKQQAAAEYLAEGEKPLINAALVLQRIYDGWRVPMTVVELSQFLRFLSWVRSSPHINASEREIEVLVAPGEGGAYYVRLNQPSVDITQFNR